MIGIVNFGLRCDGRHLESEKIRERASFADRSPSQESWRCLLRQRLRCAVEVRSITGDNPNIERFLESVRSDN